MKKKFTLCSIIAFVVLSNAQIPNDITSNYTVNYKDNVSIGSRNKSTVDVTIFDSYSNSNIEKKTKNSIDELKQKSKNTIVPYLKSNGKYVFVDSATMTPVNGIEFDNIDIFPNEREDTSEKYSFKHDNINNIFIEERVGVENDGKWGFVDNNGNLISDCIYKYISNFHEGLARVMKDNKCGFIDKNGKIIIPLIYDDANELQEGIAYVSKDRKHGFVDNKGNIISDCIYNNSSVFHEGMCCVQKVKDGTWGFINKKGEVIVPFIYHDVSDFHEGFAKVSEEVGYREWYIDKTGKIINNVGILNKSGKAISPKKNENIKDKNGKWGVIDKNGKVIIPCIYENPLKFHDGIAMIVKNNKGGYINKTGKVIIPCYLDRISDFHEGIAIVVKEHKLGAINKTGKEVISFGLYNTMYPFNNGFAKVNNGGKYFIIDIAGREYRDK